MEVIDNKLCTECVSYECSPNIPLLSCCLCHLTYQHQLHHFTAMPHKSSPEALWDSKCPHFVVSLEDVICIPFAHSFVYAVKLQIQQNKCTRKKNDSDQRLAWILSGVLRSSWCCMMYEVEYHSTSKEEGTKMERILEKVVGLIMNGWFMHNWYFILFNMS